MSRHTHTFFLCFIIFIEETNALYLPLCASNKMQECYQSQMDLMSMGHMHLLSNFHFSSLVPVFFASLCIFSHH